VGGHDEPRTNGFDLNPSLTGRNQVGFSSAEEKGAELTDFRDGREEGFRTGGFGE
jgi:hypothetical protein